MKLSRSLLLRRLFKWIANLFTPSSNNVNRWEFKNVFLRFSGLNISKNGVAIGYDFHCLTGLEENIYIEEYVAIGHCVKFWNYNEVSVGKFCMIAADCVFTNGGHNTNNFEPFSGRLNIGKGCWIGNGVRVVGPVTIGDNAVIGAGAVVINDIPPESIAVGIPAKVIGTRTLPKKVWHLGNIYFCPNTFKKIEDDT